MNTTEGALNESDIITSADIRKELFEGDNVRTKSDPKEQKFNINAQGQPSIAANPPSPIKEGDAENDSNSDDNKNSE